MTVLETLTQEQAIALDHAKDQLTLDMLDRLEHGEEVELNEIITLYKYCEEDIVVLNRTDNDDWEEILQVMWDDAGNIIFEAL